MLECASLIVLLKWTTWGRRLASFLSVTTTLHELVITAVGKFYSTVLCTKDISDSRGCTILHNKSLY